jgi:hypothetical protein
MALIQINKIAKKRVKILANLIKVKNLRSSR